MNRRKTARRKLAASPDRWVAAIGLGVSIALFLAVVISGFFDVYARPNGSFSWPIVWQEVATKATLATLLMVLVFGYVLYVNISGRRWTFRWHRKSSGEDH